MTAPDKKTLATLTKLFEEEFGPIGDRQVLYVHAPGRSEISGNHTDHEGGHVIAGSLDVAVDGIAVATDSNKIRVADEGYPTFEITLDTLDIQASEKGTSASLVRGMAHEIAALGVEPHGFDFAFTCSVPSGGGLSSSAAVEAAIRSCHGNPLGRTRHRARRARPDEPAHREQLLRQALRSDGPGRCVSGRPCLHGL